MRSAALHAPAAPSRGGDKSRRGATIWPRSATSLYPRVRLRKLTNPTNCKTADIDLAGVPVPHTTGTADCRNASNTVVGVLGVATADHTP
jgi:hypothetical protein